MSWQSRVPKGVSQVQKTADGFTGAVSIPPDEDGFIGRHCASCHGMFRMHADEYSALLDGTRLTCPYCGHEDDADEFATEAQRKRALAGAEAIGEQFIHDEVDKMLRRGFGGRSGSRSSRPFSIEIKHRPGRRPPIRALPQIVEERVLRTITCPGCATHYAVYGTSAFCPVCGPRAATDTVLEGIAAGRGALTLEEHLAPDQRDAARAAGVFDRLAADTLKNIVTLFEVFARDQFNARAANAAAAMKNKGNVFQRLDDTARLFTDHCAIDLPATAGPGVWQRLREDFARRHVLTHCDGIIDAKFLAVVPNSPLRIGQRLVVGRADADRALDDVEAVVNAIAALP